MIEPSDFLSKKLVTTFRLHHIRINKVNQSAFSYQSIAVRTPAKCMEAARFIIIIIIIIIIVLYN
jgi:hypothetical protein